MEDSRSHRHGGLYSSFYILLRCQPSLQVSEETVFNDKNGLHLGTGPYLLLYSRAIPESLRNTPMPWPDVVKVSPLFAKIHDSNNKNRTERGVIPKYSLTNSRRTSAPKLTIQNLPCSLCPTHTALQQSACNPRNLFEHLPLYTHML